jgi:sec-independent protein translocase protein TatA
MTSFLPPTVNPKSTRKTDSAHFHRGAAPQRGVPYVFSLAGTKLPLCGSFFREQKSPVSATRLCASPGRKSGALRQHRPLEFGHFGVQLDEAVTMPSLLPFWGFTNPSVCRRLPNEMTGFWFMNALLFGFIGMWETVAILAVILVLFGAKKVPELARGLGQGIKEFKKATKEVNDDLQRAFDDDEPTPPRKLSPSKPQETVPHSTNEPKG